jgi:tetratricopeptide (TPR) repeat protein
MKTLYDLLGALPDDDADELRAAFRKAAKANHPDNNPDNPEAAERFRKIVRANAILSDGEQRAAYDRMLVVVRRQQGLKPKRSAFSSTLRRLAADAAASAVVSILLIGGYLLYRPFDGTPIASSQITEASARKATQAPAIKAADLSEAHAQADQHDLAEQHSQTEHSQAGQHDKLEVAAANVKPDINPRDVTEPAEPEIIAAEVTVAPVANVAPEATTGVAAASADASPAPGFGTKDAQYYRERGIQAYRIGDLYIALVNFDLAISLDPNSPESYIDRGIVFHRLGDQKRAFSDVTEAKRLEAVNRNKTPSVASAPQR